MMEVEWKVVEAWEKKTGRLTECPVPAFVETLQQRLLSHYGQETRPIPMDNCYQLGWDGRVVGLHLRSTGVSTLAELPGIYSLTSLSGLELVGNTSSEPVDPRRWPNMRDLRLEKVGELIPPRPERIWSDIRLWGGLLFSAILGAVSIASLRRNTRFAGLVRSATRAAALTGGWLFSLWFMYIGHLATEPEKSMALKLIQAGWLVCFVAVPGMHLWASVGPGATGWRMWFAQSASAALATALAFSPILVRPASLGRMTELFDTLATATIWGVVPFLRLIAFASMVFWFTQRRLVRNTLRDTSSDLETLSIQWRTGLVRLLFWSSPAARLAISSMRVGRKQKRMVTVPAFGTEMLDDDDALLAGAPGRGCFMLSCA